MAEGHSNSYNFLSQEHGLSLPGVDDQGDLVPFQRFVLQEHAKARQEEIEEKQDQAQSSSGQAGGKNPLAQPNGGNRMSGETVEYVNTHGGDKDVDT